MNRLAKFTEIELIDALKCLIERVKVLKQLDADSCVSAHWFTVSPREYVLITLCGWFLRSQSLI